MWTADFTASGELTIVAAKAAQVNMGSFVIFRDSGATSELVRAYADANLGTRKFRDTQDRWKRFLGRAVLEIGGFNRANSVIRSEGAASADTRGWVAESAVRPNRRSDFQAACRFAGLGPESEQIWSALSRIRSGHQRAGQMIRKQLELALIQEGGQQLEATGFQKFEVEGLGALSVYRVVHRYPDIKLIDQYRVDIPFRLKGNSWPG